MVENPWNTEIWSNWDEDSKTKLTKKHLQKQKHQPKSYLSNNIPKMMKRLIQPGFENFSVKQSALLPDSMAGKEVSLQKLLNLHLAVILQLKRGKPWGGLGFARHTVLTGWFDMFDGSMIQPSNKWQTKCRRNNSRIGIVATASKFFSDG